MELIFIDGLPAAGKLTVGRKPATGTGFKLFHNHLVVDLLLPVFEFGSPEFVELRERIWDTSLGSAVETAREIARVLGLRWSE